ncbi:MAG: flagellin [Oscillospiraceae bacterium]|nr:flagellin [Oscillospiraceae bacterium]
MIIKNNIPALRSFRESRKTNRAMAKNLEKLSSGYRINRAGDDAAGLSISEKMRAQITELGRCQSNVSEGLSLAKTADAALQELNDMLCRAQFLCVEAENGTYSEQELTAISDELNQLFGEIDRITASSKYNTIPLFRLKPSETYQVYDKVYEETITVLAPDQLELWGTIDFVKDEDFDPSVPAKAAEAEFKLKDISPDAPSSVLEDKFIIIDNTTYHFTSIPANHSSICDIDLREYGTVKEALEKGLTNKDLKDNRHLEDVSVSADGTVTLKALLKDLNAPVNADGNLEDRIVPDGDGEYYNNRVVQNPLETLEQVDGLGATNNKVTYTTPTLKYSLSLLPDTLTEADLKQLKQNTIRIFERYVKGDVDRGPWKDIELKDLDLKDRTTKKQVAEKIAEAIEKLDPIKDNFTCTASYNEADDCLDLTVKLTSYDGTVPTTTYIKEIPTQKDDTSWTSKGVSFPCKEIPGTMETNPKLSIDVDKLPDLPFSFTINGKNYLYYNPLTHPLTTDGYPETKYSASVNEAVDISGWNDERIRNDVIEKIMAAYSSRSEVEEVTVSGNIITVTGMVSATLENLVTPLAITVTPYKNNYMLNYETWEGYVYFQQDAQFTFDLGDDINKLAGKGFSVEYSIDGNGGNHIEFTNGPGKGVSSSYTDVDISSCKTAADVASTVQKVLPSYKVKANGNKLEISRTLPAYYTANNLSVIDGKSGIIAEGSVKFSGGTNATQSQAVLDFSSINSDNLSELRGKGFRINCATCEGEYINIFFCWESDGTMPPEFQVLDPTTGEMRTIHNIPVELSKVTSGEKIVESIVSQVKPSLNHYTDLEIGEPPSLLIAKDKRIGDVTDGRQVYLGRIQSGLVTNFTYNVNVKVPENASHLPADGSMRLLAAKVNIYVGSEPNPQYIPIHLPYIDLEQLQLSPPEEVDLNADDQNAAAWLEKLKNADIAISDARGTIGADFNRLEHAFQVLSKTEEEVTSSEGQIRDADMAELMMENIKLQILTQAQQTMMVQANTQAQNVLQLLS